MTAFVDGFVAELGPRFSAEDTRFIRDKLYAFTLNFEVRPIQTAIVTVDYQLPMEYKMFMVSKKQDGRMNKRSARQYKMCLEDMLTAIKLPVQCIKTEHIRAYLFNTDKNKVTGEPLSPYTRNARKSMIRSFFTWLKENGYISDNPTAVIKTEKTTSVEPREPLTDEEVELLKLTVTNLRDRALVEIMLATGVRVEEFVCIKKSDVDFTVRSIRILGKGSKWRTVYYSKSAAVHLKRYLDSRNDDSPYLIVTRRGAHQLTTGTVRLVLRDAGKAAGVNHLHPHRLRHTFASDLEKSGCPIEVIQELLGHSNLSTTRTYVKVDADNIKATYERYMK
jgi:integrase/recombinase XerD